MKTFIEQKIEDFRTDFGHKGNCDIQPPCNDTSQCDCGYEQVEMFLKNALVEASKHTIETILDRLPLEISKYRGFPLEADEQAINETIRRTKAIISNYAKEIL